MWRAGSSVCFDFPLDEDDEHNIKTGALAAGAGEEMKASYSYREIEKLLERHGFLIYEHLDSRSAENRFCEKYNQHCKSYKIIPPKGVNYILAVKK